MNKKITASLLFIMGLILGLLAKFNYTTGLDSFIYNFLIYFKSPMVTTFFKIVTNLGSTWFIILLNLVIIVSYLILKRKEILIVPINSCLSVIFNNILKIIIRRPRPDVLRLIKERNFSYPSGHAMISFLFYITVISLINKSSIKYKKIINGFITAIIIMIGLSRVYLGVHHITDIIGGYLISTSILIITLKGESK
ncbi:MAG: phosphatase PAP2 family protein [Bacilli bacterium]|nr:phosphatase PAP2 family protein [Bacilli bacterium]